jgi:positive regulator of sigma E activity
MGISTFAASNSGIGASMLIIYLVILVLAIAGMWATFQKAGRPGWAAIIPIYNIYTLVKVAGRDGWWVILFLIPFVNIIVSIVISLDVAKAFGKSQAFGIIGLWLFSIIGYLMLGFGDATYKGQSGVAPSTPPVAPAAPTPPQAPAA